MQSLFDTDTLSEIMEGKNAVLLAQSSQYYRVFRRFSISAVTLVEIESGLTYAPNARHQTNFTTIKPFLEAFPIGSEEAITAGRIIGLLKAQGQTIGSMDPLIAATAIELGLPLITGNTRHYQRIVDLGYPLQLQNWRSD